MMRATLMMLVLLPAAAVAQEGGPRVLAEGVVTTDVRADAVSVKAAGQQAGPARVEPRRRPSMVGYIGDSTIASQVRLRLDSGFGVTAADRAEFFYAKCGCYRGLPSDHAAYDPDAAGPGPGIATDLRFRQLYLRGEYAMAGRASVFVELPIRWLQPQAFEPGSGSFPDSSGLSDLRLGAKASLQSSSARQVTVRFQVAAPTGDSRKGLGTNLWKLEPALLYSEQVADRLGLEAQFGAVLPTDGSAGVPTTSAEKFSGNVLYYGIGPSFDIVRTDRVRVAPIAELVGWRVLSGFQTAGFQDAAGTNIVNLKVGGRVVSGGSSVYVGYGFALTDATWYDDILRVEYRFAF